MRMTTGIKDMRENIYQLDRSLCDPNLADDVVNAVEHIDSAACILLKTRSQSVFVSEALGLAGHLIKGRSI